MALSALHRLQEGVSKSAEAEKKSLPGYFEKIGKAGIVSRKERTPQYRSSKILFDHLDLQGVEGDFFCPGIFCKTGLRGTLEIPDVGIQPRSAPADQVRRQACASPEKTFFVRLSLPDTSDGRYPSAYDFSFHSLPTV